MTPSWFQREPVRVVQFLLRKVDAATEDPEWLAETAGAWQASAMLINAAGFSAWYPTELAYQRGNASLRDDFLGAALQRAHALGVAVIGRIDVSKTLAPVAAAHPDWLRRAGRRLLQHVPPRALPLSPLSGDGARRGHGWSAAAAASLDDWVTRGGTLVGCTLPTLRGFEALEISPSSAG
jgi:hypothetical protein